MAKRKQEPWVSIPYSYYWELYKMTDTIKQLRQENKRMSEQLLALRLI